MIYKKGITSISINKLFRPLRRRFSASLPSSTKDPDLERVLTRNRRWIVNNQIKNLVLKFPDTEAPLDYIQKKFPALGLRGDAHKYVKKYPCCFETRDGEEGGLRIGLTKRLKFLVDEEEATKDDQEPVMVRRLTKLLLLSRNRRLSTMKLNDMRHGFGFPDDYLIRSTTKHPEKFRIVQHSGGRGALEVELLSWDPDAAVSSVEASAAATGGPPLYKCCMPSHWAVTVERFNRFNSTPYVSPYSDPRRFVDGSEEWEKRAVGVVHELLTLTLWKKASVFKLGHFRWEFGLPHKLGVLLLKHPGVFYVSNRYKIHTVVLRECFIGGEMVEKDPLVVVKEKFGKLMQEGLHEYNQRHRVVNLEKKRVRRLRRQMKDSSVPVGGGKCKGRSSDSRRGGGGDGGDDGGLFLRDAEERKRFYDVLFEGD